eukprot:CAMPEP_0202694798 /NCGR_PEP_ID=MMETSP1385-20130828/8557_1 /ASSEMBLY_ACC=CAM_ASM_000861 /TAXON_ID=933848 /ORGANISM="Elphidium margaritaceum" /LENGTH=905 /DNA_ID=CAMNT_0049350701 /DNA_START=158 /DNA_END=2875 /DNA_ORIENTATION=+
MDYAIDIDSVQIIHGAFECIMVYKPDPTDNSKKLKLSLSRVIDSTIRLFVTEQQGIRPRYQLKDDIVSEKARRALPFDNVEQSENGCTLSWNHNKYAVQVEYAPFKLVLTRDNVVEMVVNEFEKFYFEAYRERKQFDDGGDDDCAPNNDDDDNPDEQQEGGTPCDSKEAAKKAEAALWEERFSTHTFYYDEGPASIGLDFSFVDTTFVYGIPEHASQLALKNTVMSSNGGDVYSEPYRLWNLDVFEYKLDVPDALYGAIPYVLGYNARSSNAVLWMNSAETYVDVMDRAANTDGGDGKTIRWMSDSGAMEAFMILSDADRDGTDADYLQQYYEITGYPQLPPLFSLGHHQCRWNYNDMDEVFEVADKFDALNVPNDVIWLDIEHTDGKRYFTWDSHNFADPRGMLDYVAASGRKMVTIVDPHIKKDDAYYVHRDISARDLWIKNRDGDDYTGWCWPGDSRYPDFTNPEMRRFWSEQFRFDKYQHSTPDLFVWNDMNEPSVFNGPEVSMPISNVHWNGVRHRDVHNIYGYYVHAATFDGLLLRSDHRLRPFVLSRSFFAGSQKYGAIWTGDNTANWEHLRASVPMLLSLSIAGLPFVGADVGGFFNNPDGELMARWYELGAYYPFFRNHAHQDTERRELWQFGEHYAQRMKNAILARYKILPYVYTLFYMSSSHNFSHLVMRPLWYGAFRSDASTYARDDAFMFGPAFYIQPICEAGVSEVDVHLPENAKRNAVYYETHGTSINVYGSGTHHLVGYQARIPVLRYGGHITCEKHRIRRSASLMRYDPITIVVALDADFTAEGYHYMDDEESVEPAFILSKLRYANGKLMNVIVSKKTSESSPVANIAIERIMILGKDIDKKQIQQVSITQFNKTRTTMHFGVAPNTLALRQPMVLMNEEFVIDFAI